MSADRTHLYLRGSGQVKTACEPAQGDASHAILHDPTTYDPALHGPPYLPKTADRKPVVQGMLRKAAMGKAAQFFKVVQGHIGPFAGLPYGELAAVLTMLRGLAVVHQSNHWATKGATYYADHLLFDRLYGNLTAEIDGVAERAVGLGGIGLVDPVSLAKQTAIVVGELCAGMPASANPDERVAVSLNAELKFLLMMQILTKEMQTKGTLSRGTDNLLAGVEDKHEEHVYLLKQRADQSSP